MKQAVVVLAIGIALSAPRAHAATTFEYLFDGGYPLAVSEDGTVVTGNSSNGFIPFRWTQADGFVSLGRPQFVGGGGKPGISADGTRIASSIGSLDSSYSTQGLWTLESGWLELMPPAPPDGGTVDGSYGSVHGLSGDGTTIVGLYWRPGVGNRAHASKWTEATGVVDLGGTITGQASRANGVNHDGSVIVGWVETSQGPWRPAAWVDGSVVLLTTWFFNGIVGSGEARAVSTNGDFIVGFARDSLSDQRAAAMWTRTNGVFGPTQILGWGADSEPGGYGLTSPYSVSDNGKVVIGYFSADGSPFNSTGFVWTETTGVQDVNEFLADRGVLIDPNFTIQGLTAMTPSGTQMFGYGQMLTAPYARKGFKITTTDLVASPLPRPSPIAGLELSAPRPNPSSSLTRLDFALAAPGRVDLSVFDATGRRVATLAHAALQAGRHSAAWDGRESDGRLAPTGLYFVRLTTPQGAVSRRLVRVN